MRYRRWGSWASIGVLTFLGLGAVVWSVTAGPPTRALQARTAGTVAAADSGAGSAPDATTSTSAAPTTPSPTDTAPATTTTAAPATAPARALEPPAVAPPVPGTGSVSQVSCASSSFCMAVGSLEGGPGGTEALIDAWDGTAWSVLPSPTVAGGTWNSLSGVSCPSPSFCVAVGSFEGPPGGIESLVEAWDGSAWSVTQGAVLNGGNWNRLNAVACTSASFCAAVGDAEGGPGGTEAVAELFDGTAWSASTMPLVDGGRWNSLSAVHCAAPGACAATGTYQSDQGDAALGEHWDGTSWSVDIPA